MVSRRRSVYLSMWISSFLDELYSAENPYTLSQQIKMGIFDYPSPYWDSVGDPALDLIDRMLTIDMEKTHYNRRVS